MTHTLQNKRKFIAWALAAIVGVSAVGFGCVELYLIYQEGDQGYWSRLYRAKSDISTIEIAAESFRREYGRYPSDLAQLVQVARDDGGNKQFLVRIPNDPWGGSYFYRIERGVNGGQSIKIWVTPDRKTQDKLRATELSNRTNWKSILK